MESFSEKPDLTKKLLYQLLLLKRVLGCWLIETRELWPLCLVEMAEVLTLWMSVLQLNHHFLHQSCLHCGHLCLQRSLDGFLDGRGKSKIRWVKMTSCCILWNTGWLPYPGALVPNPGICPKIRSPSTTFLPFELFFLSLFINVLVLRKFFYKIQSHT